LSEKGDLMVYLKVVRLTAGTFKWNKPAEPEPPTKNSPTRIRVLSIRVYEYTVIKIVYAIVPILITIKRRVNIL